MPEIIDSCSPRSNNTLLDRKGRSQDTNKHWPTDWVPVKKGTGFLTSCTSADVVSAVYLPSKHRFLLFCCTKIFTHDSTPEFFQSVIGHQSSVTRKEVTVTVPDLQRTFRKVPGTPRSPRASPPGRCLDLQCSGRRPRRFSEMSQRGSSLARRNGWWEISAGSFTSLMRTWGTAPGARQIPNRLQIRFQRNRPELLMSHKQAVRTAGAGLLHRREPIRFLQGPPTPPPPPTAERLRKQQNPPVRDSNPVRGFQNTWNQQPQQHSPSAEV